MAWYADETCTGDTWEGCRVDRWVHILAQMMFAVNEREDFVGRTLSVWGDLGAYPLAWQLDGITREQYDDYLELLQGSIAGLYDTGQTWRFVQEDGTDWTEAALFTAAGTVNHWLSLGRPSGLAPYLQLKAVIEKLLYVRLVASIRAAIKSRTEGYGYLKLTPPESHTVEETYQQAVSLLGNYSNDRYILRAWQGQGGVVWQVWVRAQHVFKLGPFEQNLLPERIDLSVNERHLVYDQTPVAEITYTINGTEFVMDTPQDTTYPFDAFVVRDFVLGGDVPFSAMYEEGGFYYTDITFQMQVPESSPFGVCSVDRAKYRTLEGINISTGELADFDYVARMTEPTYG